VASGRPPGAWLAEVERRLAGADAGTAQFEPWEDVPKSHTFSIFLETETAMRPSAVTAPPVT
jgi:Putative addiction module component